MSYTAPNEILIPYDVELPVSNMDGTRIVRVSQGEKLVMLEGYNCYYQVEGRDQKVWVDYTDVSRLIGVRDPQGNDNPDDR